MNENVENNEFLLQLPEETKEKIRNCKTEEEAMEILKGDMVPIPDDVLADVAGGDGYFCGEKDWCWGYIKPCNDNYDVGY